MVSTVWGGVDVAVTQPFLPGVHDGIDIGVPSGTTIYAARAGYVERVQTGMVSVQVGSPGNLGPVRDFYLHGSPWLGIVVGHWVKQGDPIISSDTVQVDPRYPLTGPHLHFEVQNGFNLPGAPPTAEGAPLDPVPVLLAAQSAPLTGYLGGSNTVVSGATTNLAALIADIERQQAASPASSYEIRYPDGSLFRYFPPLGVPPPAPLPLPTPAPAPTPAPVPPPPLPAPAPSPSDPNSAQQSFWSLLAEVFGSGIPRLLAAIAERVSNLRNL